MTFQPLANASLIIRPFERGAPMTWAFSAAPPASSWVAPVSTSCRPIIATAISVTGYGNPARQAVALLREFGFERLGLFRLEIVMGVDNTASEAVAIAAGATFECRARNRIFLRGQPLDAHVYSFVLIDCLFSQEYLAILS